MAIPLTNPPVIFRNKQLANHFFGMDNAGQIVRSVPRFRFLFYVNFVIDPNVLAIYPDLRTLGSWEDGISFMIKSIDRPRVDMTPIDLNEYNRKRIVYSKVKYSTATMQVHDTVDDRMHRLWLKYFRYYFGDSRPKSDFATHSGLVEDNYYDGSGWGLRPLSEAKNFFQKIQIYAFFGNRYTQIDYINPRITSIDFSRLEQNSPGADSDSTISFDYEFISYTNTGQLVTAELADQFGFTVDVTIEPQGVQFPIASNLINDAYSIFNTVGSQSPLLNSLTNSIAGQFGFSANALSNLTQGTISPLLNQINGIIPTSVAGTVNTVSSLFSNPGSINNVLGSFGNFNFGSKSNDNQLINSPANITTEQLAPSKLSTTDFSSLNTSIPSISADQTAQQIDAAATAADVSNIQQEATLDSPPDLGNGDFI